MGQLTECTVCGKLRLCEQHHIRPQAAGGAGTETIPLCTSCHDYVDRIPLDRSSAEEQLMGWMQLWGALDVEGRLLLLKLYKILWGWMTMDEYKADIPARMRKKKRRQTPAGGELPAPTWDM